VKAMTSLIRYPNRRWWRQHE